MTEPWIFLIVAVAVLGVGALIFTARHSAGKRHRADGGDAGVHYYGGGAGKDRTPDNDSSDSGSDGGGGDGGGD